MTEKRFRLMSYKGMSFDIEDNGKPMGSLSNICEELNILHEEREYWKQKYKKPEVIITVDAKDIEETILKEIANLKKENKQLKSRLMVAEDKLHGLMNNE